MCSMKPTLCIGESDIRVRARRGEGLPLLRIKLTCICFLCSVLHADGDSRQRVSLGLGFRVYVNNFIILLLPVVISTDRSTDDSVLELGHVTNVTNFLNETTTSGWGSR